jgi:protein O-GlcNAc transferase
MIDQPAVDWQLASIRGLIEQEQWSAAEANCRQLLAENASEQRAWHYLSLATQAQGLFEQSEIAIRRALAIDDAPAIYWDVLASVVFRQNRWQEMREACSQSLARNPGSSTAWSNLGAACWALGLLNDADSAYAKSLALSREDPSVLMNSARLALQLRQPERALKLLEEVLNRDPRNAAAWFMAGDILELAAEFGQAIAAFRQAVELEPARPESHQRLALLLIHHGSLSEAERLVEELVAREPESPHSWGILAALRQKQVRDDEAAAALRRALSIEPSVDYHSNLLQVLQYAEEVNPQGLLDAHRHWDSIYAAPLYPNPPPSQAPRRAKSLLRLGFVSADFGRHPTGFLGLRPLECLDKSRFSLVCYYDRILGDDFTARFRAAADDWRVIQGWSAEKLAEQVRSDGIDILFDLTIHTGSRLLTFARRPAPVQITWLGYVGTTGMRAMDFLLADHFHVRPGEEKHYAEQLLYMPNDYICFGPPTDTPDIAEPPASTTGRITFGCFNNPAKLSSTILDVWADILNRIPDARLLIKNRSLNQEQLRDRLHAHFAQHYIPPQRVLLESGCPYHELLASYGRVDIALDTQPYSGGLTTCEALWMGAPVITFAGKTFAGRHSTSHLINAGYGQFVAEDAAAYIELAVHWARRIDELATLRRTMREQVRQLPLCDAARFANDFMTIVQQAWELRLAK